MPPRRASCPAALRVEHSRRGRASGGRWATVAVLASRPSRAPGDAEMEGAAGEIWIGGGEFTGGRLAERAKLTSTATAPHPAAARIARPPDARFPLIILF